MKISIPLIAAGLATCLCATQAGAQFTTVVQPPPANKPTVPAPVASDSTARARDTAVVDRLADMTAWVDSAAVAIGARSADSSDTAKVADTTGGPTVDSAAAPRRGVSEEQPVFRDGAPAPETATMLPLLALAGAGTLGLGLLLLRR